jgi:hypothetical protein
MSFAAELTVLITVPEGIIPFLHQFVGEASRGTAVADLGS